MRNFCIYLMVLFLFSCSSYKKLSYLQDIPITGNDTMITSIIPVYRIQPSDLLNIKVVSNSEKLNQMFNLYTNSQSNTQQAEGGNYINNYIVNDSGFITMPIIKKLVVKGLTTTQIQRVIEDSCKRFFNDVQVLVRLSNFRFTILGEVKMPGAKIIYDDRLDIIEAIGYGGDLTYNANRKSILVLRPVEKGYKTFKLDVSDYSGIKNESFYILPNDIILVEPLKMTLFRERSKDYITYFSVFTSGFMVFIFAKIYL